MKPATAAPEAQSASSYLSFLVDYGTLLQDVWKIRFDQAALRKLHSDDALMRFLRKHRPVEYARFWTNVAAGSLGFNNVRLIDGDAIDGSIDAMRRYITLVEHHDVITCDKRNHNAIINVSPGRKSTRDTSLWMHFTRHDTEPFVRLSRCTGFEPSTVESLVHLVQFVGRETLVVSVSFTVDLYRPPTEATSFATKDTLRKSMRRLAERFQNAPRMIQTVERFFAIPLVDLSDVEQSIEARAEFFETAAGFAKLVEQVNRQMSKGESRLKNWTELTAEQASAMGVDIQLRSDFESSDPSAPAATTTLDTPPAPRPPFGTVYGVATIRRPHRGVPLFLTLFTSLDHAIVRWRLVSKYSASGDYLFTPMFEAEQAAMDRHLGACLYPESLMRDRPVVPMPKIPLVIDLRIETEPTSRRVVAVRGASFLSNEPDPDASLSIDRTAQYGRPQLSVLRSDRFEKALRRRDSIQPDLESELSIQDADGAPILADFVTIQPTTITKSSTSERNVVSTAAERELAFARRYDRQVSPGSPLCFEVEIRGPIDIYGTWRLALNSAKVHARWTYGTPGNVFRDRALRDTGKKIEQEYWLYRKRAKYLVLRIPVWAPLPESGGTMIVADYNYHYFVLCADKPSSSSTDSLPGDRSSSAVYLPRGLARDEADWPRIDLEQEQTSRIGDDVYDRVKSITSAEAATTYGDRRCHCCCKEMDKQSQRCYSIAVRGSNVYRPFVCSKECETRFLVDWERSTVA